LTALPEVPDSVIISVPVAGALKVVHEAEAIGAPSIVLFCDGFINLGTAEGARQNAELMAIIERSGMAVQGPNCMGALGRRYSSTAATELEHDNRFGARGLCKHRAKARPILDALDNADDDLGLAIIRKPLQIVRGIDCGLVATGDERVEPKRASVAEFDESIDETTALGNDRNAARLDGVRTPAEG